MKLNLSTIASGICLTVTTIILTTPLRRVLYDNLSQAKVRFKAWGKARKRKKCSCKICSTTHNLKPWGKARKRKKSNPCEICSVSVLAHESLQDHIADKIVPELSLLTEIPDFVIFGRDFEPGWFVVQCYLEALAKTSTTVVFVDQALLADPGWLNFTLAHSLKRRHRIFLCIDENVINFQALPQNLKDLILSQKATLVSFNTGHSVEAIAETMKGSQNSNLHSLTPSLCIHENHTPMLYDAYLIHDGHNFDLFDQTTQTIQHLQPGILTLTSSEDFCLGRYLYQEYSKAIHSSQYIFVLLTDQLIQDPLFEYQLGLALHCRGNKGVIFVLDQNNPVQIQIERDSILEYALCVCRKVVL